MGLLNKVKEKSENIAKKGLEVGKDVGEKGVNLGKKGVDEVKDSAKKDEK